MDSSSRKQEMALRERISQSTSNGFLFTHTAIAPREGINQSTSNGFLFTNTANCADRKNRLINIGWFPLLWYSKQHREKESVNQYRMDSSSRKQEMALRERISQSISNGFLFPDTANGIERKYQSINIQFFLFLIQQTAPRKRIG